MIQEAHIGVGIYGQEGMRAVQSSDFALPEFQGLWRLLFVHGRWSYIRISEMILYFFYKNMIFTIPQFYFAFISAFSAQSVFDDFYITLYNLIFTALPLLVRAAFEQDVNYKKVANKVTGEIEIRPLVKKHFPKLYYIGQKNKIFTQVKFLRSVTQGLIHGALLFLTTYFVLDDATTCISASGITSDFWYFSITLYTSVIVVVDLKLAVQTRYWTILSAIALIGTSLLLYTGYVWAADMFPMFLLSGTTLQLFTSWNFYLIVSLNAGVVFVFDIIYIYMKARYYTSLIGYMRTVIKKGNSNVLSSFNFLASLRPSQIRQFNEDDQRALKEDMSGALSMQRLQQPGQQIDLSVMKSTRRNPKEEAEYDAYMKTPEGSYIVNGGSSGLLPSPSR